MSAKPPARFWFQPHPDLPQVSISRRCVEVLRKMDEHDTREAAMQAAFDGAAAYDNGELTYAKGGGWWLGLERIHGRTARTLLQACALRGHFDNRVGDSEHYVLNDTGRAILARARELGMTT